MINTFLLKLELLQIEQIHETLFDVNKDLLILISYFYVIILIAAMK